ncbi:DUF550 domain-containing protein [Salmonella enterica]|nr:DUF550 domain-containing protein [Salmonella enterica]
MSNIDKQALREAAVAIETFRVKVTPQVVLALLDENLQLQREKDAIEAVALALRDDMRQAREQLEAAEKRIADGSKRIAELENSETQLINERDAAESALADMYQAATGERPEWSNMFGFADAVDVVEERLATLEANQSQTTPTGIQLITEAIGAHGYIVGCLLQGRPDLALEESRKWVTTITRERLKQIYAECEERDPAIFEIRELVRIALASLEREQIRREHAEWSDASFGDVGPIGPLKHLSKEALEAAAEPDDLSEWADMQFLLWDAQRRAGISDEQITRAMVEKLAVNKQREWPAPKDGEPRLHIKEQPVPVVPPAIKPDYEVIKSILPTANPDEYACCIAADMWNACRAAMLSQRSQQEQR